VTTSRASSPLKTERASPFVVGTRALSASLSARFRGVARRLAAERTHGVVRLVGIAAIALSVALFVFAFTFAAGLWIAKRGATDIAQAAVAFSLLGLAGALLLSSLGHAASAFFTAHDLWFWESSPAPRLARFLDRMSETALTALPSTVTLGALALAGFLLGSGLGVMALLRAYAALILIALLPLSLGIALAHTGGAILPAGRLRRLSLIALGVLLTGALIVVRRARVEDLVTPEGAERLVASARSLTHIGPTFLPHNQGARFALEGSLEAFAGLAATSLTVVALAFLSHALFFDRARDRAADESPTGLSPGSMPERALLAAVRPVPARLRPLVEKDLLAFVRDPAQWGQVILLLGVGVLYLVNATAMARGMSSFPTGKDIVMTGLHTGIATFIAAGLSVRFAFPIVGLEGPAVWILEAAPIDARDIVRAKAFAALPVVGLFPTLIALLGGFVIDLPLALHVFSTVAVALTATCFALYAVARGALRPAFDAVSVSELAMGPGALGAMMTTLFLSFVAMLLSMAGAERMLFGPPSQILLGPGLIVLVVPIAFAVALRAERRGARALLHRRRDGTAGREGIGR
jgi:ABC-2 type transport system permease protein